jgi:exosortase
MQNGIELTVAPRERSKRLILFGLWLAASLFLFARPLLALLHFSLINDDASHIMLIPFMSAWVVYLERQEIFRRTFYDLPAAVFLFLLSAGIYSSTYRFEAIWGPNNTLTGYAMALVLLWDAGFALVWGREALKTARFSLLFLFLAVPLPDFLLNRFVFWLQEGSATITAALFDLTGVPVLREGFIFHLGRVSIEIAKECSGIRSSMALLILALLAAHLFLRTFWRKTVFVLVGILLMIVKNGIRIVTLTLLALYVDPGFLFGKLHHEGGVVFFLLALLLYTPFLLLLQWSEKLRERNSVLPIVRQSS